MVVQYIIVGVIVTIALVYAFLMVRKALSVKSGDPCYGCALKKVCKKEKRLRLIKQEYPHKSSKASAAQCS